MSAELHDERISAYLDGELSAGEHAEVEALLHSSSEYRQLLTELKLVRESFQSLPRYSLGADFSSRVIASAKRTKAERNGKAIVSVAAPTSPSAPTITYTQSVGRQTILLRRGFFGALGTIAAIAASIALVVALSGPKNPEEDGKIAEAGENLPEKVNSAQTQPPESEFRRLLASASQSQEAVVVRVRLSRQAIAKGTLGNALRAEGIEVTPPNVDNPAAQEASRGYRALAKSQSTGSGSKQGPGEVFFVEAEAARVEQALARLNIHFAPEALIASTSTSRLSIRSPEGEADRDGNPSVAKELKVPAAGYAQHLPPRSFVLPPAATSAPTSKAAGNAATKKPARVLILVEIVD